MGDRGGHTTSLTHAAPVPEPAHRTGSPIHCTGSPAHRIPRRAGASDRYPDYLTRIGYRTRIRLIGGSFRLGRMALTLATRQTFFSLLAGT